MDEIVSVREGTQNTLDELDIGAVVVTGRSPFHKGRATLTLSFSGNGEPWAADIEVEPGTLIPAARGFHRVTQIKGKTVMISRAPESVVGLTTARGAVLFLGQQTIIHDNIVALEEISTGVRAHVVIWDRKKGTFDKKYSESLGITTRAEVSLGTTFVAGNHEYNVEAIVLPERSHGIVGWIVVASQR